MTDLRPRSRAPLKALNSFEKSKQSYVQQMVKSLAAMVNVNRLLADESGVQALDSITLTPLEAVWEKKQISPKERGLASGV